MGELRGRRGTGLAWRVRERLRDHARRRAPRLGRKYSLFAYPFVTACCGMEFMAVASPRFDMARFGAEAPRFSPRQADLFWVVGTISQRQAPALRRIYEQMTDPKCVLAFGTCASLRRLLRQLHDGRRASTKSSPATSTSRAARPVPRP